MNANEHFNLDLERSILNSCIFSEEAYNSIAGDILPEDFSLKLHQDIFKAIMTCASLQEPISLSFVKKHLKIDEKIFQDIIANSTIIDVVAYCAELRELAIKRELVNFAYTLPNKLNENKPIYQITDEIGKNIFNLTNRINSKEIKDMQIALKELIDEFTRQKQAENKEILGLDTGFHKLNKMIKGFKKGDLIIIAARPGMGKTTMCLNFIDKVLRLNKGVVLFSLEMPSTQIMQRLISAKTSVPLQNLLIADCNDDQWTRIGDACKEYQDKHLYIYDSGYVSITDIRAILRRLKSQDDSIELCVIDYIGLMMGNSAYSDRHLQVSEISRGLKLLARELDIPIIALSQLNRSLESRNNKRPMLSDLRESGAIEQDADTILFVYRDEVYREQEEKEKENKARAENKEYQRKFFQNPKQEKAELIIGKNRNGPIGSIDLLFLKENSSFVEFEEDFENQNFE